MSFYVFCNIKYDKSIKTGILSNRIGAGDLRTFALEAKDFEVAKAECLLRGIRRAVATDISLDYSRKWVVRCSFYSIIQELREGEYDNNICETRKAVMENIKMLLRLCPHVVVEHLSGREMKNTFVSHLVKEETLRLSQELEVLKNSK